MSTTPEDQFNILTWAVIVAHLVERSLLTPEVHGLNPVIGKIYIEQCLLSTVLKRQKINKKRPGIVS